MLHASLIAALALGASAVHARQDGAPLKDWPRIQSAVATDADIEKEVARILAGMTLEQKVGQMTQPEIKSITPEEVRRHHIGSVLNGGGSWPGMEKRASVQDWVELADAYYEASMSTDAKTPVPIIWGTDAMHGHSNVFGATLFPHNIGLGAAHDPALIREIARATAHATRATGITWVFAPTVAVAQDPRWGRTYESYSASGELVHDYAVAAVQGLQDTLGSEGSVVATAKHFIGDGATDQGRDQGNALVSKAEMINVHGQGYFGALEAGAQTVMASFSSWHDEEGGVDYGKMHGAGPLLTGALKEKMGFDGFVVSDWNGIGQLPGCTDSSCAQAINAGIDMVMVPDAWKAFIDNTVRQVRSGEIPEARIDDAVSRILRVKLRAGLFEHKPSDSRYAGDEEALRHPELARRAVRESLVLMKNADAALPLKAGQRVLVVGKSADSLSNMAGGWSLTWQGTDNTNDDYPHGTSLLDALRKRLGPDHVVFSETGKDVEAREFDAVVAVIGETPYAEGIGDIMSSDTLTHSQRHPEDLAVLEAAAATGKPVVTVFLSGRPLYTNDLINLSDAFVAAWLPGTEGEGVTDVLFASAGGALDASGRVAAPMAAGDASLDFRGRLTFPWPGTPCWKPGEQAQFAPGYGLSYAQPARLGELPVSDVEACGEATALPIFRGSDAPTFTMHLAAGSEMRALGNDLNATVRWPEAEPAVEVRTVQVNVQQDAKEVTWLKPARVFSRSASRDNLNAMAASDAALQFDMKLVHAPESEVILAMECGQDCAAGIDLAPAIADMQAGQKRTVTVPLSCFAERGLKLDSVNVPFSVEADAPFAAAFTDIRIAVDAANESGAIDCGTLAQ
nr:glycoside hydrolase family 3 N-terminal domain-containing protein [Coralloluteibacterium stylophorae]